MPEEGAAVLRLGMEAVEEGYGYFLGNTLSTGVLALGTIFMARLLGAEDYGIYTLALVLPNLLSIFTGLGIELSIIKSVAELQSRKEYGKILDALKSCLILRVILSAAVTTIIYLFSDQIAISLFNRPYLGDLLKVSSIAIILQSLYQFEANSLVGLGKASITGKLILLQAVFKVSTIILLILLGLGVLGAVSGHVLGFLAASLAGFIFGYEIVRRWPLKDRVSNPVLDLKILKPLIAYGLILYASTIFLMTANQYNRIILARFVSDAEIGGYMAALNVSVAVTLISTPIGIVLFPTFSKIKTLDRENLPRAFQFSIKYILLLMAPVAIFISLFSKELILLIYGPGFEHSSSYLSLYALLYMIIPISMVERSYFNGTGMGGKSMLMSLIIFLTTIPLSPLLASLLKVIGVIASTIIATSAAASYATYYIVRHLGIAFEYRGLMKIYLASIAAAIPAISARFLSSSYILSLKLGGVIYLLTYLTLLGILEALSPMDRINLRRIFERIRFVGKIFVLMLDYVSWISEKVGGDLISRPTHPL